MVASGSWKARVETFVKWGPVVGLGASLAGVFVPWSGVPLGVVILRASPTLLFLGAWLLFYVAWLVAWIISSVDVKLSTMPLVLISMFAVMAFDYLLVAFVTHGHRPQVAIGAARVDYTGPLWLGVLAVLGVVQAIHKRRVRRADRQ